VPARTQRQHAELLHRTHLYAHGRWFSPAATATTLLISINPDTLFVRQGCTFYVRTRYQRYIGDFVLHCHILDHEDKGMMQNVSNGIPDGRRSQH
jgi:FtsP/CotA-like multicopper oxidase with cupredoxin domain